MTDSVRKSPLQYPHGWLVHLVQSSPARVELELEIDEVVQQLMLALLMRRHRASLRGGRTYGLSESGFYRAARWELAGLLGHARRRRRREIVVPPERLFERLHACSSPEHSPECSSPEYLLMQRERRRRVVRSYRTMPTVERKVLRLHLVRGWTLRRISKHLRCGLGTVHRRWQAGLDALKEELEPTRGLEPRT